MRACYSVVLIHFLRLLQVYCLVFVYGQVVRHILGAPTSQRCGQLLESFFYVGVSIFSHSGMLGNISNALFWVVCSVYVTISFKVACHFVSLYFKGDV